MTDFDIAIRAYEAQCDDAEEEPKTYCDGCGKPSPLPFTHGLRDTAVRSSSARQKPRQG